MASQKGLIGPVVRAHGLKNGELVDDQAESNGDAAPQRKRRRRPPITEKGKGRNLKIPDSVFRRLELDALNRGIDNSKRVTQLLDANLPFFELVQKERPPAE